MASEVDPVETLSREQLISIAKAARDYASISPEDTLSRDGAYSLLIWQLGECGVIE